MIDDDGCDCDDELLCHRIRKTMMVMYVCMHVFIDISMYVVSIDIWITAYND